MPGMQDEFVERLQPHFRQNRVRYEFGRYLDNSKEKNRTATRRGFVSWMLRAYPELRRLSRPAPKVLLLPPELSPEQQAQEDRDASELANNLREFRVKNMSQTTKPPT